MRTSAFGCESCVGCMGCDAFRAPDVCRFASIPYHPIGKQPASTAGRWLPATALHTDQQSTCMNYLARRCPTSGLQAASSDASSSSASWCCFSDADRLVPTCALGRQETNEGMDPSAHAGPQPKPSMRLGFFGLCARWTRTSYVPCEDDLVAALAPVLLRCLFRRLGSCAHR